MPRGGRRSGTPGKTYPNRTDMHKPEFKGQPQGAAKAQAEVQASGSPGSAPGPSAPPAAPPGPAAGSLGAFNRPSDRPEEPITAGLSTGPGPGPDALGLGPQGKPEDVDMRDMAIYLPTLEMLASQPGASMATKTFVRRLRGQLPPPAQGT
jgi:hypothetical protein